MASGAEDRVFRGRGGAVAKGPPAAAAPLEPKACAGTAGELGRDGGAVCGPGRVPESSG